MAYTSIQSLVSEVQDRASRAAADGANLAPSRVPSVQKGRVPVLVFGSGLTAIGVIRSLGRAGIPVFCVCSPSDLVSRSRWYRPLPESARRYPKPGELVEFLRGLSVPRAVLVPCSDDWAKAVAGVPDELRERYPASSSPFAVIDLLVDKWQFAQMLEREKLPHPDTTLITSLAEMGERPASAYENMFLKPMNSQEFNRRHSAKAFLPKDKSAALAIMTKVHPDGGDDFPIMLQEYIPGPPTSHYFVDGFVDSDGRIRTLFARRRLRMYPPLLGNSTLMETVPLEEVKGAVETIEKMWSVLPYRGIFSAEFKFDHRDGKFKILEVNARPWWYIEFTTRSGIDVCSLAYRDALGMPLNQVQKYKPGRRCVYLSKDLKAYREVKNGHGSFLDWAGSWMGAKESVFCWDDPMPALSYFATACKGYVQGKLRA